MSGFGELTEEERAFTARFLRDMAVLVEAGRYGHVAMAAFVEEDDGSLGALVLVPADRERDEVYMDRITETFRSGDLACGQVHSSPPDLEVLP